MEPIKRIAITGGSGFVGRAICAHEALRDCEIRIITRDQNRNDSGNIRFVAGDVFDDEILDSAFSECDAVIHLIGILNERGHDGSEFRRVHTELPAGVARACKRVGVRRLVHMSALKADAVRGPSHYLRSKGAGEDAVFELADDQLAVTSFQPSVIFGPDDSFVNLFNDLMKFAPMMPLACPDARFAPVYVGDVADRFVSALSDDSTAGQRIPLCGPREYSLIELVKYIAEVSGKKRLIFGLPDFASRMQANMLEYVPGKPFSRDNYASLQIDSTCPGSDHEPTAMEDIVPTYI